MGEVELNDEDDFAELHRLYNFTDDDSRQFTRWQMLVALRHGRTARQALKDTSNA